MIPNAKNIYEKIAKDFTLHELMVKLQCSRRTIPRSRLQKYVKLQGYSSISEWQSENTKQ